MFDSFALVLVILIAFIFGGGILVGYGLSRRDGGSSGGSLLRLSWPGKEKPVG